MFLQLPVAAVQMTSHDEVIYNLDKVTELCIQAIEQRAKLIVLPENFGCISADESKKLQLAEPLEEHSFLKPLRVLAQKHRVFIVAGSVFERSGNPSYIYNTCAVLGDTGQIVAAYRKIHLFDVAFSGLGLRYGESDTVLPGSKTVTVDVLGWKCGLSICYDLRFPELYRRLVSDGAEILLVPSAFTAHTGKDHWDVLLRARAVENQCFVIAPNQFGKHSEAKFSWGKSMLVDPWGSVLASAPEREGVIVSEFNRDDLVRIRMELPSLSHRRL